MKRKDDPRHKARVSAMQALFEKSFRPKNEVLENPTAFEVFENREKLDAIIEKNAPAWPLSQIAPVDLAILRLAIWELLYKTKKEPYKAVVDEAVEIAKEYGSDASAGFVNGVLGAVIKQSAKREAAKR